MDKQYFHQVYVPTREPQTLQEAVIDAELYFAKLGINISFRKSEPTETGTILHYGCDAQTDRNCQMKLTIEWDGTKVVIGQDSNNELRHSAHCCKSTLLPEPPWRAVQVVIERWVPLGASPVAICAFVLENYKYNLDPSTLYEMRLKMKRYGCQITSQSPPNHYLGAVLCHFWHANAMAYLQAEVHGWILVENLDTLDSKDTWHSSVQRDRISVPLLSSLVPLVSQAFLSSPSARTLFADCCGMWIDCGKILTAETHLKAIVAVTCLNGIACPLAITLMPHCQPDHWNFFLEQLQVVIPELKTKMVENNLGTRELQAGIKMQEEASRVCKSTRFILLEDFLSSQILGSLWLEIDTHQRQEFSSSSNFTNNDQLGSAPNTTNKLPISTSATTHELNEVSQQPKFQEPFILTKLQQNFKPTPSQKICQNNSKLAELPPVILNSSRSPPKVQKPTNELEKSKPVGITKLGFLIPDTLASWSKRAQKENFPKKTSGFPQADCLRTPSIPNVVPWASVGTVSRYPSTKSLFTRHDQECIGLLQSQPPFEISSPRKCIEPRRDVPLRESYEQSGRPNMLGCSLQIIREFPLSYTNGAGKSGMGNSPHVIANERHAIYRNQDLRTNGYRKSHAGSMTSGGHLHKNDAMFQHRMCLKCHANETPVWRRGPKGPGTLCNACGLHFAKIMRSKIGCSEIVGSNDSYF